MNLTAQARLREWAREVDEWRASGMSQQSWCKSQGITYTAFKYHKGRVEAYAAGIMQDKQVDIVPLPDHGLRTAAYGFVNSGLLESSIEIEFCGVTVRANSNVTPDLLRTVLEVLTNA